MSVSDGVYTPLTFDDALNEVIAAAPASISFDTGDPELILANMFAQAMVLCDENNGEIMALMMSPVGAMIDAMNPNNPRKAAIAASGYIEVENQLSEEQTIPADTVVTSSTGQTYTVDLETIIPASSSANVLITASAAGISGNIDKDNTFTITGFDDVTATNPLPLLSGAEAESDATYLNRLILEKTEYGTQSGSVAVETELKKSYSDAYIYVNNSVNALTTPVPVPTNGYNLIVRTPSGVLAEAEEISQIFDVLANRLELVNSQRTGDDNHEVMSGTVYSEEVPLSYYFTVAQPVDTTLTITINIRASENADESEVIEQANTFATNFINRLMTLLGGIDGTTTVTYDNQVDTPTETEIDIEGITAQGRTIAPAIGVGTIQALVSDLDAIEETPLLILDEVESMEMVLDPDVAGEPTVTLEIGGTTFVDFANDELFLDYTSWYDRYIFIDPANIDITIQVAGWF